MDEDYSRVFFYFLDDSIKENTLKTSSEKLDEYILTLET